MERIAVITGGSKGIGFALVRKFLSEGFKVISVSRSEGELITLKTLHSEELIILNADLSNREEARKVGQQIADANSQIHILINNAGIFIPGEMHNESDEIFESTMALNLNAAYYISKALIPALKQSTDAYIFNICSTASKIAYSNGGAYCISKHALYGMSKVLRQELIPFGVAVSSVLPGATLTDSWKGSDLPADRFMTAESVAEAIWYAWTVRKNAVMEEILLRPLLGDI